jgi:acetyltransferase
VDEFLASAYPEGIDLGVILTPAATLPAYLEACGKQRIAYVIIESGGFAEFSKTGQKLEQECLAIARRYNMRLVGPNCIGVANPSKGVITNFVSTQKEEILSGRIAMMAQSGGVIMTCGDILAGSGLGISKTVSMGNKIDLQEGEYLEYFLNDPDTDSIFMYLESVGDGRRLFDLARRSTKPVMIYKSNTTPASAAVAASHTAALANDEQVLDAAFKQAGILRIHNLKELVACSKAFSLPVMRGNRLAIFTRSGGYGIVAADLASDFGFELPPFSQAVLETVRPYFRVNIMQENNPLDLGTVFDFDSYKVILETCNKEMQPDGLMLIFNYRRQDSSKARQVAHDLANLSRSYQVPIALVFFTEMEEFHHLERTLGFPIFSEVHEAIQGLAAWRSLKLRSSMTNDQRPDRLSNTGQAMGKTHALKILSTCARENRHPFLHEALEICQVFDLPVAPWRTVEKVEQLGDAANQLGFPLALKVVSTSVSHKTEAGGIVLNITDSAELDRAAKGMQARLAGQLNGFVLQKMLPSGRELILGGKHDPAFGPTLLVGLGGIFVEVLRDTALRLAPVSSEEARQMIGELKGYKILNEIRGQPAADVEFLVDCLVRFSQMMVELPAIQEFDINPLLLYPQGGAIVDARISLNLARQQDNP